MFTYIPKFNELSDVEYADFRNEEEREFLTSLYNYSAVWEKYGFNDEDWIMFYDSDIVTVALDICGNATVLRSLRIDLTKTSLLLGEDETFQYVSRLDINNPTVKKYRKTEYEVTQLAELAAEWLAYELSRKIELREWINGSSCYRQCVLADVNKSIVVSNSSSIFRRELGQPDRITIIYPLTKALTDKSKP